MKQISRASVFILTDDDNVTLQEKPRVAVRHNNYLFLPVTGCMGLEERIDPRKHRTGAMVFCVSAAALCLSLEALLELNLLPIMNLAGKIIALKFLKFAILISIVLFGVLLAADYGKKPGSG